MVVDRRPDTGKVDSALVEALSFVVSTLAIAQHGGSTTAVPSIRLITDTAIAILVDRQGYDRRLAKLAIASRLRQRSQHLDPSYVPSLQPDPVQQAARAYSASTPPLLDQTQSSATS